jgi:hypothetical protein
LNRRKQRQQSYGQNSIFSTPFPLFAPARLFRARNSKRTGGPPPGAFYKLNRTGRVPGSGALPDARTISNP